MTADSADPDPTAVMVRRIIAYCTDLVIYLAAALVPLAVLVESRTITVGESLNRFGRLDGDLYVTQSATVYTITESQLLIAAVIFLSVFLLLAVVLQGLTGKTVGKAVTGISTVRPDGTRPGVLRALIRSLCWIIDGIPTYALPLVGGTLAFVSTGHRRVGDMLGRTYVVHYRYVGMTIIHPDEEPTESATPEREVVPAVIDRSSDEPVAEDRAATEAAWAPNDDKSEAGTGKPPVAEASDRDTKASSARSEKPTAPRWDRDRRAYISYDPRRGEWVQHDAETGEWGPITRA